jgi:hypothetical protein
MDMFGEWHTYDTPSLIHLPHENKKGADDEEIIG